MPSSLRGTLDYTQLKQNWKGEWNESTIYYLNDTVRLNGKAYVCNSTYYYDNNLYGWLYRPGTDTTNWTLIVNGSVFKGDWSYKDRNFAGDIVRYNGDYYQCVNDNFGGHPIYKNGALTSDWVKIAQSSREDRARNHMWFAEYPPMGWTRNNCETNTMYGHTAGFDNIMTINGNGQLSFIGYDYNQDGHGLGERSNGWTQSYGSPATSGGYGTWQSAKFAAFDFWDYMDGYRTSLTGGDPKLIQISGTDHFTMALFDTGEVYSCGYGVQGNNGDGSTTTLRMMRRVGRSAGRGTGVLRDKFIIKIGHSVKSGNQESLDTSSRFALASDGTVWTWGYNGYGSLGLGDTNNRSTPTQIPQQYFHNKPIADVWMFGRDYQCSLFLTTDGYLYACGYNGNGQLGIQNYSNSPIRRPELVYYNWDAFGGIKKVTTGGNAGYGSIVVQTNDGQLHVCGNTDYYILGAGSSQDTSIPIFSPMARLFQERIGSLNSKAHRELGQLWDVTRNVDDYWYFNSGGNGNTIIVKEKETGLLYGWGYNVNSIPYSRKAVNVSENIGADPTYTPSTAFPSPIEMGNLTDVKHIARSGETSNMNLVFQNSDGRLWTNGQPGSALARGFSRTGGGDPNAVVRRTQKLPWEFHPTTYTPTQIRTPERANIIAGYGGGSIGGCAIITTNNRLVATSGQLSWNYGLDPANQASQQGFTNATPTRFDV